MQAKQYNLNFGFNVYNNGELLQPQKTKNKLKTAEIPEHVQPLIE